jgi:hypothetical protein
MQPDPHTNRAAPLPTGAAKLALYIQGRLKCVRRVHEGDLIAISGVLIRFPIIREHNFFEYLVVQVMVARPGYWLSLLTFGAAFDVSE